MKEVFKTILALIILVGSLIMLGFITINLGIMLPYHLWQHGEYGLAILQVLLVINYIFGGNHK